MQVVTAVRGLFSAHRIRDYYVILKSLKAEEEPISHTSLHTASVVTGCSAYVPCKLRISAHLALNPSGAQNDSLKKKPSSILIIRDVRPAQWHAQTNVTAYFSGSVKTLTNFNTSKWKTWYMMFISDMHRDRRVLIHEICVICTQDFGGNIDNKLFRLKDRICLT